MSDGWGFPKQQHCQVSFRHILNDNLGGEETTESREGLQLIPNEKCEEQSDFKSQEVKHRGKGSCGITAEACDENSPKLKIGEKCRE